MENSLMIIYIIGSISTLLFMLSYIPDVIKTIKTKEIKGVTLLSSFILSLALICAIITNTYFKNWPFVINDIVCFMFNIVILINRYKKIN